jgi:hypothetical protein
MDHDAFDARLTGSVLQPFVSDYCAHLRRGRYSQTWFIRFVEHQIGDRRIAAPHPKVAEGGSSRTGPRIVSQTGTG